MGIDGDRVRIGPEHARLRRQAGWDVLDRVAGERSSGPPAATDQGNVRPGLGGAVVDVRCHVRQGRRPPIPPERLLDVNGGSATAAAPMVARGRWTEVL